MEFLAIYFLSGFFCSFCFFVLGSVLYYCGFKNYGHYLLAISFAPFFTLGENYIKSKCPDCTKCSSCKKWTCSNFGGDLNGKE